MRPSLARPDHGLEPHSDDRAHNAAPASSSPSAAADTLPLSSSAALRGLRAQQLYHILASLTAMRAQMHDHSGAASSFDSELSSAVTAAAAPLESLVLRSFTQPASAAAPLRAHWTLLAANRQLVAQIAANEAGEINTQARGLAQIRLCLTAQLQDSTHALKAALHTHKSTRSDADDGASDAPLPADVLALRQRCTAIHADLLTIDTQLERMHAQRQQYARLHSDMQERHTAHSAADPQQHSSLKQAMRLRSPAFVSLHSTPASRTAPAAYRTPLSAAASAASTPSSVSSVSSVSSAASSQFSASSQSSPASDMRDSSHLQLLHFPPILPAASATHSPAAQSQADSSEVRSTPPTPLFAIPSDVSHSGVQSQTVEHEEPGMQLLFAKLGSGSPWRTEVDCEVPPPVVSSEMDSLANEQPGLAVTVCPPPVDTTAHSPRAPAELSSPIPPAELPRLSSMSPVPPPAPTPLLCLDPLSPRRLVTPQQQLLSRAPTSALRPVMAAFAPSPVVGPSAAARSPRPSLISPELQAQLDTPFSALKKQLPHSSASPLAPSSLSLLLRQQEEEDQRLEAKVRCMQRMQQLRDDNADTDKLYDHEDQEAEHEETVRCLHAASDEDLDSSAPIPTPQHGGSTVDATPLKASSSSGWQASFEMRSNPHVHSLLSTLQSFTDSTQAMMESPAQAGAGRAQPTPPSSAAASNSSAKALLRRVQRINIDNQCNQLQQPAGQADGGDATGLASKAPLPASPCASACVPSSTPSEWFDLSSSRFPLRDITNDMANGAHGLSSPAPQAAAGGGAGMVLDDENAPANIIQQDSPLRYSLFRPQDEAARLAARRREAAEARAQLARQQQPDAAAAAAALNSPLSSAAPLARPASAPSSAASASSAASLNRPFARRSLGSRPPAVASAAAASGPAAVTCAAASSSPSSLCAPASTVSAPSSTSATSRRRKSGEERSRPAGTIVAPARPRPTSAAKPKPKTAGSASAVSVPIRIPASLQAQPQTRALHTQAQPQAAASRSSVQSPAVAVQCGPSAFPSSTHPGVENAVLD